MTGFKVEVAWDKVNWTDETDYVDRGRSALSARYGRDQITALAPTVSGEASLVLDNATRRFSPRNTASPLYGLLKPARPVRITRTLGVPPFVAATTLEGFETDLGLWHVSFGGGTLAHNTSSPIDGSGQMRYTKTWAASGLDTTRMDNGPLSVTDRTANGLVFQIMARLAAGGPAGIKARIEIFADGADRLGPHVELTPGQVVAVRAEFASQFVDSMTHWTLQLERTASTAVATTIDFDVFQQGSTPPYTLFVGHTDDSPINPDPINRTVAISCLDSLADFRAQTITTGLHVGIRTGEAIALILDACGWDQDLRDLDPGATVAHWWWEDGTDASEALERVVRSEGPPAMLFVGADGSIVFRDRHHRLTRSGSLTSQGTLTATGSGWVMGRDFAYDDAWSAIVNTGTASVENRTAQPLTDVWTSDATTVLTDGEAKLITVSGTAPFFNAQTPEAGIDWEAIAGTVEAELFRTSGGSTTIRLLALGGPATIANLKLRAQPLGAADAVEVSARDQQSVDEYGPRSFPGDLPWCGVEDAQSILETVVAMRAEPLTQIRTNLHVGTVATRAGLLGLNLSDRLHITEPETSTDADFYLESIAHGAASEYDHSVTLQLEAAHVPPTPLFRFDTPGAGFDEGKWGKRMSDPGTLFRFDTAGAGFDQGRFAG